jgi:hypothetical protein
LLPDPETFLSLLAPGQPHQAIEPTDGFRIDDGEIQAAGPRVFVINTRRLMRYSCTRSKRGLEINPDLAQRVRNQLGMSTEGSSRTNMCGRPS